jgi:hypothetical protein
MRVNRLEVLRTRKRPNFTIYLPDLVHYTVISNQSIGNYGHTGLSEDGVSRDQNASEWKLRCNLVYTV